MKKTQLTKLKRLITDYEGIYDVTDNKSVREVKSQFNKWSKQKNNLEAFKITDTENTSYWFALVEWKTSKWYLIILPEAHSKSPLMEIHLSEKTDYGEVMVWYYTPKKGDGQNEARKEYFKKYAKSYPTQISIPATQDDMTSFFDDIFDLAAIRIESDALDETPVSRGGFPEGKKVERKHKSRERNSKLIAEAKKAFREEHGKLFCQICFFDFEKKYGNTGKNYIQAHHTRPLSDLLEDHTVTKIEDLAMVCANCHVMIHLKRPWLSMEDINKIVKLKKQL